MHLGASLINLGLLDFLALHLLFESVVVHDGLKEHSVLVF